MHVIGTKDNQMVYIYGHMKANEEYWHNRP